LQKDVFFFFGFSNLGTQWGQRQKAAGVCLLGVSGTILVPERN